METGMRHIEQFDREGYVILPGVIDAKLADNIKAEMLHIDETGCHLGYLKRHTVIPSRENQLKPKFRFKDLYVNSDAVRQAVFAPAIIDVISTLAGEAVMAFQNLGFVHGSGHRIHCDSNFVAVEPMEKIVACWIALEDVEAGNGELVYYPGSHRLPTYYFSADSSHWVRKRDGIFANEHYVEWLQQQVSDQQYPEKHFLARKGDCIIWHAALAHAGSPIRNHQATRYSLITHFCPLHSQPNYFNFFKQASRVKHSDHCYFSSCHYDLTALTNSDELKNISVAPIIAPPASTCVDHADHGYSASDDHH